MKREECDPTVLRYGGGEEGGSRQQVLREQFPLGVCEPAAVLVL